MIVRLPPFTPGQTIGLLGGSFDPPHAGHRLISELALRRLRLDRLWWLVTPGNPLKETGGLAATRARVAASPSVSFNGLPGVTSHHSRSSRRRRKASSEISRWPAWGGSKVPPSRPIV